MSDTLVKVEDISKKFCKNLKRSLWYGVKDLGAELIGLRNHRSKLRKDEFWALKNINFELKKGELIGLIGSNGAGKSTLLRLLTGLIKPDEGRVSVRGRLEALISLGAGFNPILTGRENVYINGAILGFSKRELDNIVDKIIDFAEIKEFIDMPVQSYSSGMYVRLGFAVAVNLKPDVLLVDEVLAVGDASFRQKARRKMMDLLHSGISVIFVSHNIGLVESLTSRCIYLDKGKIVAIGPSEDVTTLYLQDSLRKSIEGAKDRKDCLMAGAYAMNPDNFILEDVVATNGGKIEASEFCMYDDVALTFHCRFPSRSRNVYFSVGIYSRDNIKVSHARANIVLGEAHGFIKVKCAFEKLPLREGIYDIGFYAAEEKGAILFKSDAVFRLVILPEMKKIKHSGSSSGLVGIHSDWELVEQ